MKKRGMIEIKWMDMLLLLGVAFLFVTLFSTSTSPLMGKPVAGDSAIFQTVGKWWAKGVLPYAELWDHKGPIIFLINAIGYWLTDSVVGLFMIQVCFLTVTEIIGFVFLKKIYNRHHALGLTFLMICSLSFDYSEGNGTEEYILPFLMISFIHVYRWGNGLRENEIEHKPLNAMIYGGTCAFALLTRATNSIGVYIAVMYITLQLIIGKRWKNLLQNIGAFLAGVMILIIPFCIYFGAKGYLYDMWYGTILFNLDYMGNSGPTWINNSLKDKIELFMGIMNAILLLIIGSLMWITNKEDRKKSVLWIITGGVTAWMLLSGHGYLHYAIITLPYFVIVLIEIKQLKVSKRIFSIGICSLIFITLIGAGVRIKNLKGVYEYFQNEEKRIELVNVIPDEDRNSFVAYNCRTSFYLEENICPKYRFFDLQDWQGKHSAKMKDEINLEFQEGDARWILVKDNGNIGIQNILDTRYTCVDQQNAGSVEYKLYKLNEK